MIKERKIPNVINRIFHIVFLLTFGFMVISSLFVGFENEKLGYGISQKIIIFIVCAVFTVFLVFVYALCQRMNSVKKIRKKHEFTNKDINLIIFISVGIMFLLQLIAGYTLNINPVTDLEYVSRYAIDFGKTGNFDLIQKDFQNGSVYLIRYPNNLAITFILSAVYRLGFLITGKILPFSLVILNTFAINISVLLTVFVAKRLFGNGKAIFTLVLCLLFPPFYTYVPYYYTDSLSLPFCIGAIYLFICAIKSENKAKKYILLVVTGIVAFVGYKLKASVILILLVLIAYLLAKFKIKKFVCLLLALIVGFGSVFVAYTVTLNNSKIVTKEQSNSIEYPYTHWLMMGLKGNGDYNKRDSLYTQSFSDKSSKQEANIRIIKERLEDFGPAGLCSHLINKSVWTWSDGTYFISHHIEDNKNDKCFLHSLVLNNGENNIYFYVYSGAFQLFLLIMICFSIIRGIITPKINFESVLRASIFAIFLFLLVWETRSRYLYNFTPIFILTAVDGFDFVFHKAISKFSKK